MKIKIFVIAAIICSNVAMANPTIDLTSKEGMYNAINSEYSNDYWSLNSFYLTQKPRNCGVASAVMVLNAMGVLRPSVDEYFGYKLFTQSLFVEAVKDVITDEEIRAGGMDIKALAESISLFQLDTSIINGTSINSDEFRIILKNTLNNPQTFIIANYHRPSIGHEGEANFSPIGAYREETDSVLVLDVLRHEHAPFWVEVDDFIESLQTTDPSGASRGLILVRKPYVEIFSEQGVKQIKNSQFSEDYFKLSQYFETQEHWTYCAIASGVTVMNTLLNQNLYSQSDFFTEEIRDVVSPEDVKTDWRGVTADELDQMLQIYGFSTTFTNGNEFSADQFRDTLKKVLNDSEQMIIANYTRIGVGQVGGGHFSPVAAYDQDSDSVLVLDTSRYKYPPVWVDLEMFVKSMKLKDDSGLPRGYMTVTH